MLTSDFRLKTLFNYYEYYSIVYPNVFFSAFMIVFGNKFLLLGLFYRGRF